jgi:hypothetical protein
MNDRLDRAYPGKIFEKTFENEQGRVGVLGELHVDGLTVSIKDLAVYPIGETNAKVGGRAIRDAINEIG